MLWRISEYFFQQYQPICCLICFLLTLAEEGTHFFSCCTSLIRALKKNLFAMHILFCSVVYCTSTCPTVPPHLSKICYFCTCELKSMVPFSISKLVSISFCQRRELDLTYKMFYKVKKRRIFFFLLKTDCEFSLY